MDGEPSDERDGKKRKKTHLIRKRGEKQEGRKERYKEKSERRKRNGDTK